MPDTSATTHPPLALKHFTYWLAAGERGLSSEAIVAHLTGMPVGNPRRQGRRDHPWDPADFRRCQLLLDDVPLARMVFPKMRTASPEWSRLVDVWDEIHTLIEQEVPGYLKGWPEGSATLAYRLMRRAINDGTLCTDCDGSGRADPCGKCKGTGRRGGGRCRARGCFQGLHLCDTCRGDGYTKKGAA